MAKNSNVTFCYCRHHHLDGGEIDPAGSHRHEHALDHHWRMFKVHGTGKGAHFAFTDCCWESEEERKSIPASPENSLVAWYRRLVNGDAAALVLDWDTGYWVWRYRGLPIILGGPATIDYSVDDFCSLDEFLAAIGRG